jgi:hypothetical protein
MPKPTARGMAEQAKGALQVVAGVEKDLEPGAEDMKEATGGDNKRGRVFSTASRVFL